MIQLLSTKLFIPSTRSELVSRARLIERLNEGLQKPLTLISAPAGFGKTTLLSEWIATSKPRVAWLSLDEGDHDPTRFLSYLIAALQSIAPNIGQGIASVLQSPQPPPVESILTTLLNEMNNVSDRFVLILDDYHVVDSKTVDGAVTFLLEHQPPQIHLIVATREDPPLPLARLRARGQLTELRAADLRFTDSEAAEFLNQVMGLKLSAEDIAALEARTEGWIAGLQLAALSMQGQKDTANFIQSFTGSHRFVMDYLVEEVLKQQPAKIQTFLLQTSILDRLCGPLCDAVLEASRDGNVGTSLLREEAASSQQRSDLLEWKHSNDILEYLERSNLFIIPLDHERRWYRYHHLFADLLRQRLQQSLASSFGDAKTILNELHIRASRWYEDHGLMLEAFHHAAAANDVERAERLVEGKGIPLHLSGAVIPILDWLDSLPVDVLNARPSLWWRHASLLLINGQTAGVAEKLQAAESAIAAILQNDKSDEKIRNLIGQVATAKSTLALTRYDIETMLTQSRRALEYLHPDSLFTRATANWTMGYAYFLQGDRSAARQAFTDSIGLSQASGAMFTLILATIGLGSVQEGDNELYQAAETYQRVLRWVGDQPQQIIGEAHLGLARIFYEWNNLAAAERHTEKSLELARQYESFIDRFVIGEVFLARLKLARGDVKGASAVLAKTDQSVRQYHFVHRVPEVASVQILTLLRQSNFTVAAQLAETHQLPLGQARVHLVQGNPKAALAVLEPYRQRVEAKGWKDEQLKAMTLQALAYHLLKEKDKALYHLHGALTLAEPGGFIRLFLDEGAPMAELLSEASTRESMPGYVNTLLAAFNAERQNDMDTSHVVATQPLVEPLSPRELDVLRLIAQGLSNEEIGRRLFLALDTVKGHNRRIFDKLQVQRRTEAVARARELGLL